MKVMFMNRKDCFSAPGGDTIQMMKTKEYLCKMYSDISISYGFSEENLVKFNPDIVHIFNIQTFGESYYYLKLAKKYNKKVALSTIYWNLIDSLYVTTLYKFGFNLNSFFSNFLVRSFAKEFLQFYHKIKHFSENRIIKQILENCDILLPNSLEEYEILKDKFKINKKYKIVFNSVDPEFILKKSKTTEIKTSVINLATVARIEPTKNQINVLKALQHLVNQHKEINIKYTIIGRLNDKNYYNKILSFLKSCKFEVNIKGEMKHEDLVNEYQLYDIHILPSFRESPGLSSLEALASGCLLVVSENHYCPINTYFKDFLGDIAFTCDPYSIESISTSIEKAIANIGRKCIINKNVFPFVWQTTAKQTYDAYKEIL